MKCYYVILFCSMLFPLPGKADWIVVQDAKNSSGMMNQSTQITLKIRGNKTRIDSGPFQSVITDGDLGDQIILLHAQKQYMVQSASQMKEGMEMMKSVASQADNKSESLPKLKPTGKAEKISGYDADEFVWEGKSAKGRIWVAKEFPNYAALRDAMENSFAKGAKPASYALPDTKTLPGMIVRSESILAITATGAPGLTPEQRRKYGIGQTQMHTNVLTLVSAKEEMLKDSDFTVPADYKEAGTSLVRQTNSTAGLREVWNQIEKRGFSEADRKAFEKIVNDAEAKPANTGR